MDLSQKIASARKKKGLTQEELADKANVTVRTIQRIESGESSPRSYTLKTVAAVLDIPFEELAQRTEFSGSSPSTPQQISGNPISDDSKHFLEILCLSCFSYILIPFVHFLVPTRLLKRSGEKETRVIAFAKKLIRSQLYWKAAFWLTMLLTLAFNLISANFFERVYLINYLWPFLAMYMLNAVIIGYHLRQVRQLDKINTVSLTD